jgi:hypothetical protein
MINHSPRHAAKSIVRYESTSPNEAAQCPQGDDFIVKRNVILPFCGSLDWRLLLVVAALPQYLCEQILLMQEHKAGLWIAWKPGGYEKYLAWVGEKGVISGGVDFGRRGIYVCNDWWAVYHTDIHGNTLPGQLE